MLYMHAGPGVTVPLAMKYGLLVSCPYSFFCFYCRDDMFDVSLLSAGSYSFLRAIGVFSRYRNMYMYMWCGIALLGVGGERERKRGGGGGGDGGDQRGEGNG